ncbi:MAG TPA: nuclear transport factor 2 family protein [Gemmatimonadales bacterium]|nr:nuclear transport factor 2 family protein [Gemmatimonadales bacterium]
MRQTVWTAIVTGALLASPLAAQTAPSPEQQLAPLVAELLDAANAHDTDRFLAPYLHDSTLVMVFNGTITRGFDQVRALQLKWWNNGVSDVVYRQAAPPTYRVLSPDLVLVTDPLASSHGEFVVTMVWQKRPEGWRIIQVHESTTH